jgi:epsilon-lactone hydrolase
VENRDLASCRVYEITPADLDGDDERIYLDIHGGGFIYGGARTSATRTSRR